MNLKQLEAFVKVTESGSFSKAAKLLFLTQPTVSAHISSLEKELDSRLFVRNTKEVKLSEEGKQLYQYARQMVELEKEIEQVFSKDAHCEEKCNYNCDLYDSGTVCSSGDSGEIQRDLSG